MDFRNSADAVHSRLPSNERTFPAAWTAAPAEVAAGALPSVLGVGLIVVVVIVVDVIVVDDVCTAPAALPESPDASTDGLLCAAGKEQYNVVLDHLRSAPVLHGSLAVDGHPFFFERLPEQPHERRGASARKPM